MKSSSNQKQSHVFLPACALAALFSQSALFAGNTWTGGGASNNWSDANNWGGSAPGYGTLTFTTGGTQGTTSNNNSITAQNKLEWTGSSSWIMNGSSTLSLFDFGGTQAKIENQSTGLVTINAPITFAANNGAPPNPFGEINAVNGNITFGSGTLTVNGSSVNGIKLFGSGRTTTFNNTVNASGKWFGLTGSNTTMAVGGAFTAGELYVMNGGTLQLNSGGSITSTGIRLGGDISALTQTGNQNLTQGGTLQLTSLTGGQSVGSIINTVANNTSGALLIDSLNTSGTNTISGNVFLDSALRINQATGGTLSITNATLDLKAQQLTLTGGGNIGITGIIGNSFGAGSVVIGVNGTAGGPTVTYSSANTYSGNTFVRAGALAFNAGASAGNSVIRLGSTSGASVDAAINLSTPTGGTTLTTTINPVSTSGSGNLSINSQNSSGTNTLAGHFGLDRNLTVTQTAGGTLNLTQTKGVDNTTGTDIKGNTLTLDPALTGSINHSGTIYNSTGNGSVRVNGAGNVTLSGTNSYTGVTTLSAGTLSVSSINNGGAAGNIGQAGNAAANLVFDGGTLRYTGATASTDRNFTINAGKTATFDINANNLTISGASSATNGALTKVGAGTLTLSGTNNHTGATTVTAGTLQLDGSTNAASAVAVGTAGTLSGSGSVLGNATLTGNGIINKSSGTIAGTLGVTGGNWNGAGGTVTGLVTSSSGTFSIGSGANLTANGGLAVTGGSITAAAANSTITGSLNYTSTTGSNYGGVIAGSGNTVTMNAASTRLTLSGSNTYSGSTFVTQGQLLVNGTNSGLGSVNVSTGATLGGIGSVSGLVNVSGVLAPGASIESIGTGSINFLTGSTFAYELDSASLNGDLVDSTGTLDIAGGTILTLTQLASGTLANDSKLTLISYFGGWTSGELFTYMGNTLQDDSTFTLGANKWLFNYNDTSDTTGGSNFTSDQSGATSFVTMTVIPEPSSLLICLLGGTLLLRRRR